jgi:hypothetical protein
VSRCCGETNMFQQKTVCTNVHFFDVGFGPAPRRRLPLALTHVPRVTTDTQTPGTHAIIDSAWGPRTGCAGDCFVPCKIDLADSRRQHMDEVLAWGLPASLATSPARDHSLATKGLLNYGTGSGISAALRDHSERGGGDGMNGRETTTCKQWGPSSRAQRG